MALHRKRYLHFLVRLRRTLRFLRLHYHQLRRVHEKYLRPFERVLFFISGLISPCILILDYGIAYPEEWRPYLLTITQWVVRYLVAYEIITLFLSPRGFRTHAKHHRIELLVVFAVMLQWLFQGTIMDLLGMLNVSADRGALLFLSISQATLFLGSVIHLVRSNSFTVLLGVNPPLVFLGSFILVIMTGTFLFMLPGLRTVEISFVDLLFTATSATCVTGLSVFDVGTSLTQAGQWVLLALIQIGGLGLMTLTAYFSFFLAGRSSMKNRIMMKDLLSEDSLGRVRSLTGKIAQLTFSIEAVGAILLYFATPAHLHPDRSERIYAAIFHSISAFCNAGFSLYPEGLMKLGTDEYGYLAVIMVLITSGGLGFPVLTLILAKLRSPSRVRFTVAARLILIMSSGLFFVGTAATFLLEHKRVLKDLTFVGQIFHSSFYSVTLRTAGFNSFDLSKIGIPLAFLSLVFMWIGASPNSTGGGIKTSTFAIATIHVINQIMGKEHVEVFRRRISPLSVNRAFTIVVLSLPVNFIAIFILSMFETQSLINISYEVLSAFGTVGVSKGITSSLHTGSKLTLITVMFFGRVGVFTILVSMIPQARAKNYLYPVEYIAT